MVTHKAWKKNLLIKYLCPRDFSRGEMEEIMKKLVCLGLCLILSGCTSIPVAKNDAERKVNANVIEVSASTIDEIEEMAIKDVEDTKEKLESERDALSEGIKDFDAYTKNIDKVKAYYEDALKQTELSSIRLREYAYKYAELIMNEDVSYKVKYKDLSGIYEYIYMKMRVRICMVYMIRL